MLGMAEASDQSTTIVDDDRPLSVRRMRRSKSIGLPSVSQSNYDSKAFGSRPFGISTPPATPKRAKKRVRFSDPGQDVASSPVSSSSSGLTPFIRRTSLSTPRSRSRHSTPAGSWNRAGYDAPLSGTLQFASLEQVLDGRVKRRIRRNRLSEEVNMIEWGKRLEAKERKTEVERLREELAAKDLEVRSLRDEQAIASQIEEESGISSGLTTELHSKVQKLEQEVRGLKDELQRRVSFEDLDPDRTISDRDPFEYEFNENMISNYDLDFTEGIMNDEMISTPARLHTSFPSPPTSMPTTPCKSACSIQTAHIGIQTSLPIHDPENEFLKSKLEELESEITSLTSKIAFDSDHQVRLSEKLTDFIPSDELVDHTTVDSALDKVLTELALSQARATEESHAFSALATEITSLGFASKPEETVSMIAKQFRQARLDLEYLTPGEVEEGFETKKLLSMLVDRLKLLVEKVNKQDDSIDQYHEQELLLRQQLNARVSAMDEIKQKLCFADAVVGELREDIKDKEIGNERLQQALSGYRTEVQSLERLIERMERDSREQLKSEIESAELRLQDESMKHDLTRAECEGKEIILVELERRLTTALQSITDLESQIAAATEEHDARILQLKNSGLERERQHGDALALRDARVSELRGEIERVNQALKTAHSTIISLRRESGELFAQVEGEKTRGQFVVQAMRDQLSRVLETGSGYVNGDVSVQGPTPSRDARGSSAPPESAASSTGIVRRGRFLDADLARKGKKRRRYDSGLGFLEEQSEAEEFLES